MPESGVVASGFFLKAFWFLAVLLTWNLIGRSLQTVPAKTFDEPTSKWVEGLAALIHVSVMSAVLFLLLIVLVGGIGDNPTDFRYVNF